MYGFIHLQCEILCCNVKYWGVSCILFGLRRSLQYAIMKLWCDKILHYFVIFLCFCAQSERERERASERERQTDPPTHRNIYLYTNEQPVFGQAQAGFLQLLLGVRLETCAWNPWSESSPSPWPRPRQAFAHVK